MAQTTLNITATVTPDGGSPLSIQDQDVYHLVEGGVGTGALGWRRITAESNYVPGRSLVHAVKDVQIGTVAVRVLATGLAELKTRMEAVIAPFEGFNYEVYFDFDGYDFTWPGCEPADISIGSSGENYSGPHLMAYQQSVTFSVPHYPDWA
jgi:hypothetical protein